MTRSRIRMPIVVLPLILLVPANASAQVAISLTGGINRGSWRSDTHRFVNQDVKPVTRVSTGLAVTIPLPGVFAVEFGGTYSQKGGRLEVPSGRYHPEGGRDHGRDQDSEVYASTLEANYFEFTALGRMDLAVLENTVSVFVMGGPAWAWEVSCQRSSRWPKSDYWEAGDTTVSCPDGSSGTEKLNRDFGLVHGGGLEVNMGLDLGFTFGVFHTVGKRNLLVSKPSHFTDYLKLRTLTFRGGVVYRIG